MSRLSIIIILTMLSAAPINADSYSCEFLALGTGARALGLGGAFVAVADDSTASYWNSAGLCQLEGSELMLMHAAKFSQLAAYDCISYAQSLPIGTIGISWLRFSIGDIPRFPEPEGTPGQRKNSAEFRPSANPDGYFGDSENALFISLGRKFDINITPGLQLTKTWATVGIGGSLKMISQNLDVYNGRGYGIDFGVFFGMDAGNLFDYDDIGKLTLGLNIQDIGTKVKWNTLSNHEDAIPTNFKYGLAYSLVSRNHSFTGALDRDTIYNGMVRFGLEYCYKSTIALRIGAKSGGFAAGFGVRKGMFAVDYSYLMQEIAGSHHLGTSLCF